MPLAHTRGSVSLLMRSSIFPPCMNRVQTSEIAQEFRPTSFLCNGGRRDTPLSPSSLPFDIFRFGKTGRQPVLPNAPSIFSLIRDSGVVISCSSGGGRGTSPGVEVVSFSPGVLSVLSCTVLCINTPVFGRPTRLTPGTTLTSTPRSTKTSE